jgi:hypothetical protein
MTTTITIASTARRINRRTGLTLRARRARAVVGFFVLRLDFTGISAIAPPLQNNRAGFYHAHATPITTDVRIIRAL